MAEAFGCDIGNAFGFISLVSDAQEDAQPMLSSSRDLNSKVGMPTDAYVTPPNADPIWVYDIVNGSARRQQILRDPANAVRAIKTQLRQDHLELPGVTVPVSPYDVYGAVTRDLVRLGNQQRISSGLEPIYDLVFTYPAAFTQYPDELDLLNRMQESIENVTLDGHHLHVIGRLPEPAAAAIDCLHYLQYNEPSALKLTRDEFTVLVFDLGHGTFDLSVVTARSEGEPYHVWANSGLPEDCGGRDFTKRLYDEAVELLQKDGYQIQNATEQETLLREVEEAKYTLSSSEEAVIEHLKLGEAIYANLTITRSRFEELTKDMLMSMLLKVQEMLDEQTENGRTIDAMILVGGGCHMPMIKEGLENLTRTLGAPIPIHMLHPSTAVSFGAARYAYTLVGTDDEDDEDEDDEAVQQPHGQDQPEPASPKPIANFYTNHAYGILNEFSRGMDGEVELLIPKGTLLPASGSLSGALPAGYQNCRILRPKPSVKDPGTDPANWEDIVWFHLDLQAPSDSLTLTVEVDSNINTEVRDTAGNQYHNSTKKVQKH